MSRLFDRRYRLVVDTIEILGSARGDALDVEFKVEKSLKPEPNKATIRIWNLNPTHRGDLVKRFGSQVSKSERKPCRVELEAGYADSIGVIFRGDLRNLIVKRDGSDFITEIEGSDGGHSFQTGRISRSFAPGTSVGAVLRACVDEMGLGVGNLSEFDGVARMPTGLTFAEGTTVYGSAEREFSRLVTAARLKWSIQNGVVQLRRKGQPVQSQAFKLSPSTGLVGSPFAELDNTVIPSKTGTTPKVSKSGLVNAKTLINAEFYPGLKVVLESLEFNGGYFISQLEHAGATFGADWYSTLKVKAY